MGIKTSFAFSFTFSGRIWHSVIDPAEGCMVLEVRKHDEQEIRYHFLDLKTYQSGEFDVPNTDWWTIVQHVRFPVLLLERYADPENPSDKHLVVYDLQKKEEVATIQDFQFTSFEGLVVKGHLPGDRTVGKQVDLSHFELEPENNESFAVQYPAYYGPTTESFQTVMEFLGLAGMDIGCEYMEWKDYIIISYYRRLKTKFERKLLVLNGDNEIYHEVQDEELDGFASGAFFVCNDLLVFILNGNQINGIKL